MLAIESPKQKLSISLSYKHNGLRRAMIMCDIEICKFDFRDLNAIVETQLLERLKRLKKCIKLFQISFRNKTFCLLMAEFFMDDFNGFERLYFGYTDDAISKLSNIQNDKTRQTLSFTYQIFHSEDVHIISRVPWDYVEPHLYLNKF